MKTCSTCKISKPISEGFHKNKAKKDGHACICKECAIAKSRQWYAENKERHSVSGKIYREATKETRATVAKAWVDKNRDKTRKTKAEWKKRNPASVNDYMARRIRRDPLFHLRKRMRERLRSVLAGRGWKKSRPSQEVFGCTYEFLMTYVEAKFKDGMTWDNRGRWHIDHIIPLSSAKDEGELLALAHYTNLQPLWAEDNWAKGGRMPTAKEISA